TLIAIEATAEFGARKWDNVLVGRILGLAIAGRYALAYSLADLPAIQIGEQISDVLMASYAHVDPDKRAPAVLRAVSLMAILMAPLSIGLGAVGPTIAHAFFKSEWWSAGPMIAVLATVLVTRPIGSVYSGFLIIVRGPKQPMFADLICLGLIITLIPTVGRMG